MTVTDDISLSGMSMMRVFLAVMLSDIFFRVLVVRLLPRSSIYELFAISASMFSSKLNFIVDSFIFDLKRRIRLTGQTISCQIDTVLNVS